MKSTSPWMVQFTKHWRSRVGGQSPTESTHVTVSIVRGAISFSTLGITGPQNRVS